MATQFVSIGAAVGTRNGVTPLPNRDVDLATITDLFDRISSDNGGTTGVPGAWATDRATLIAEVTVQIEIFQKANNARVVDSAIDPGGTTLRTMNRLAADPPAHATIMPPPGAFDQDFVARVPLFAANPSLPGAAPLVPTSLPVEYSRRLVAMVGSSIKWFGVVVPTPVGANAAQAVPLIFFTPTPHQHPAEDRDYGGFGGGWGTLWDDYTDRIGGLLAASSVNQILVLPFYRNDQASNLGSFLVNWQDTVAAVVTAALNDMNPFFLDGAYTFDSIVTASFSNGVGVHQVFNSNAIGAKAMTTRLFDLDGQAQTGGSNFHPENGVFYANSGAPRGGNPRGSTFFVGGRWSLFDVVKPQTSQFSHHACSEHLLCHGLSIFCS